MTSTILLPIIGLITFVVGLGTQKLAIRAAYLLKWLDIPNARRKHRHAIPIIGGLGVVAAWAVGVGIYGILHPGWFGSHASSLAMYAGAIFALSTLGVVDDVRGLSPWPKLGVQLTIAILMLAFEPQLHWTVLGYFSVLGAAVWPLAVLWIVGVTNAINLIDGLDGLAGGTSALVAISILVLAGLGGSEFNFALMLTLVPAIAAFLWFNWNPARIFLGDNGSLVLGFAIATQSLTCRPNSHSWIMMPSVALMLGYPILDMGLAVLRRARHGLPLFKADRNHLHFRVQRLGLTTRQTAILLLSVSVYLQATAICVNLLSPAAGVFGILLVGFSIFTLLFTVKCMELARLRAIREHGAFAPTSGAGPESERWLVNIELAPLYEVALLEERVRYQEILRLLEATLRSVARGEDEVIRREKSIAIHLTSTGPLSESELRNRYRAKLASFFELTEFHASLSGLPVTVSRVREIGRRAA